MICTACGAEHGAGARFCSNCGRPVMVQAYAPVRPPLERPRHGRMIAGVCAGFAQHYGWNPVMVRLVLCLAALCGAGTPVVAYLIAWIVMPNAMYVLPPTTSVTPS